MKTAVLIVALLGLLQVALALQQPINPELLEEASYAAEYGGKIMPVIDDPEPAEKKVTCEPQCPEPKHIELITPEFKPRAAPEPQDEEDDDGEYMTPEIKTPPAKPSDSCEPECPAQPEPVVKNGVRIVSKEQIGEDQNIAVTEEDASGSGHSTEQGGIGSDESEAIDNAAETGEGTTEVTVTTTKIGTESQIANEEASSSEDVAQDLAESKTEGAFVQKRSKLRKRRKHRPL